MGSTRFSRSARDGRVPIVGNDAAQRAHDRQCRRQVVGRDQYVDIAHRAQSLVRIVEEGELRTFQRHHRHARVGKAACQPHDRRLRGQRADHDGGGMHRIQPVHARDRRMGGARKIEVEPALGVGGRDIDSNAVARAVIDRAAARAEQELLPDQHPLPVRDALAADGVGDGAAANARLPPHQRGGALSPTLRTRSCHGRCAIRPGGTRQAGHEARDGFGDALRPDALHAARTVFKTRRSRLCVSAVGE